MTTTPLPAGAPGRLALRLKVGRLGRAGWLAVAGVVSLGGIYADPIGAMRRSLARRPEATA